MVLKVCFVMYKMICFAGFGIIFILTILSLNGIVIESIPYLGIVRGMVLLILSAIMCITSFVGCSGLTKSNYICILISTLGSLCFAVLLSIFIIILLAASDGYLKEITDNSMKQYYIGNPNTNDHRAFWDRIQQSAQCCGKNGTDSWVFLNLTIPETCKDADDKYFQNGCYDGDTPHKNKVLFYSILILWIIMIVDVGLGCFMGHRIHNKHRIPPIPLAVH